MNFSFTTIVSELNANKAVKKKKKKKKNEPLQNFVCVHIWMLAWKLRHVSMMKREPSSVVGMIQCKEP